MTTAPNHLLNAIHQFLEQDLWDEADRYLSAAITEAVKAEQAACVKIAECLEEDAGAAVAAAIRARSHTP